MRIPHFQYSVEMLLVPVDISLTKTNNNLLFARFRTDKSSDRIADFLN